MNLSLLLLNLLHCLAFFFLPLPRQPRSTLFPYTTLFRSREQRLLALSRGIHELTDSVFLIGGIKLGTIDLTVDEMTRKLGDLLGFERIFPPERDRAAAVMQIVGSLGDEFRQ